MDKSSLETFINNLKDKGVETFSLRVEGGNMTISHNPAQGEFIALGADGIDWVCYNRNGNMSQEHTFDLCRVPYENIDNAKAYGLSFKEGVEVFKGCYFDTDSEEFKQYLKSTPIRRGFTPEYLTLGSIKKKNEDGKLVSTVPVGSSGYVVNGLEDSIEKAAAEKAAEEENNNGESGQNENTNTNPDDGEVTFTGGAEGVSGFMPGPDIPFGGDSIGGSGVITPPAPPMGEDDF